MTKKSKRKNKQRMVDLFLDSGAFSAWTQDTKIDIDDYIAFIKKHEDIIDVYANLDVIGDAKATWRNQRIMEKAGLNPLPVYHLSDEKTSKGRKYLDRCLEYPYFCLGGMARGFTPKTRMMFLDRCFNVICDTPDRMPKTKVHGFGLTGLKLMLRYPWYSVDSTTWVMSSRMGTILVPRYKNGGWVYDERSWSVCVSSQSPNTKEAGKHISTFTPRQRDIIIDYIHSKGYKVGASRFKKVKQTHTVRQNERWAEKRPADPDQKRKLEIIEEEGVSNRYQLRDELNILYFVDLEKSFRKWPWPFEKGGTTNAIF